MQELLLNPVFIVFASATIISVVSTLAYHWHRTRQAEMETALKHEMLQRGMSADEIQKVIEASSRSGVRKCHPDSSHGDEKVPYRARG
jgi:hypothetical protein